MHRYALAMLLLASGQPVAAGTLRETLDTAAPGVWVEYRVPTVGGRAGPCCVDWKDGRSQDRACRLDDTSWNTTHRDRSDAIRAPSMMRVLLRRSDSGFDRVRAVAAECPVDPGQASVLDAGEVEAIEAVDLLATALSQLGKRERSLGLAAIALHDTARADQVLIETAQQPGAQRRDALFWLAEARGEPGFAAVRDALDRTTDADVARHAVFALSISPVAAARRTLRVFARDGEPAAVRGDALLWLAQAGDVETESLARAAIASATDERGRDAAVFALSQLPVERAVAALRSLLGPKTSRGLRRQALFWLGQIDDPAAMAAIDELLRVPASR